MRLRIALIIPAILLFISFPLVTAVTFVDVTTGQPITRALVRVENGSAWSEYLLSPDIMVVPPPFVAGTLILLQTSGSATFDYYAQPSGIEDEIPVHPAGLVIGGIVDERESLIVRTPIAVRCPTYETTLESDATGQFRAILPAESCMLAVAYEGRAGSVSILVPQGDTAAVTISVTTEIATPRQSFPVTPLILILVIVALLAVLFILYRKNVSVGVETASAGNGPSFVANGVKEVLKEKERLIVDELLLHNGRLTVRELRFNTQLPRTSLLRTLEGLETRGILLKREEHGRLIVELIRT